MNYVIFEANVGCIPTVKVTTLDFFFLLTSFVVLHFLQG